MGASLRDRFFVEGVHRVGDRVVFASDDAHKIVAVLRARGGDQVEVIDSSGAAFAATLDVHDGAVHATLLSARARPSAAETRVTIAQAIPKGQKMDLIVEKATELGVAAIVPLRSARVAGDHTGEAKRERWQRLAKTAAQQCGRPSVPAIEPVAGWSELLARFDAFDRVYLAWELAPVRPLREVFEPDRSANVLVVVGPEGGFAADEVARAEAAGAVTISLGARVLRTETVALVVLAALRYARAEL